MDAKVQVAGEEALVSDFRTPERVLPLGFVTRFPLGPMPRWANGDVAGALPFDLAFHLLAQRPMPSDAQFAAYIGDLQSRWANCGSASAHLRHHPSASSFWAKHLGDKDALLEKAAALEAALSAKGDAPALTAEQKTLLEELRKTFSTSSSHQHFSSAERSAQQGTLKALLHRFGAPTLFFSVAPHTFTSTYCLRLCTKKRG